MDDLTLPPVAKSIHLFCKKCDAERYHTVLAHTSTISAKTECEVCKSKKTYKITDPAKAKKKKVTRKRVTKADAHKKEYEGCREKIGTSDMQMYSMKQKFEADTAIDHPKFGIGFITAVTADKVEVIFEDEQRLLVHNRN